MVYVDEEKIYPWAKHPFKEGSCHMTADTIEELHAFALKIGMKRSWFQDKLLPHYDLTPKRRALALSQGAIFKSIKEQLRERRK